MKFVLLAALLFLVTISYAKKADKKNAEFENEWPTLSEGKHHHMKKYSKSKPYHSHQKYAKEFINEKQKYSNYQEAEPMAKNFPYEVPREETELQSDIKVNKKLLREQQTKEETGDLHLQDLTYEEQINKAHDSPKSSHHHQESNHKSGHHLPHKKGSKSEQESLKSEEKLFADHSSKKHSQKSGNPILEDSFETLNNNEDSQKGETRKHAKKTFKHKKAVEKSKKSKYIKKDKNEKKNKGNKNIKKHKKEKYAKQ